MSEVILSLVIAALLGLMAWERHETKKEQAKFINALISKSAEQYRDLELTDKVKPIETPKVNTPPEFIPESDLTDEQFKEQIKNIA